MKSAQWNSVKLQYLWPIYWLQTNDEYSIKRLVLDNWIYLTAKKVLLVFQKILKINLLTNHV